MTKIYNKLVRDKIPEIIEAAGERPITRILDNTEFLRAVIEKIGEEKDELAEAQTPEDQMEELADLQELIHTAVGQIGSLEQLEAIRIKKAAERGSFTQQIFLESTE